MHKQILSMTLLGLKTRIYKCLKFSIDWEPNVLPKPVHSDSTTSTNTHLHNPSLEVWAGQTPWDLEDPEEGMEDPPGKALLMRERKIRNVRVMISSDIKSARLNCAYYPVLEEVEVSSLGWRVFLHPSGSCWKRWPLSLLPQSCHHVCLECASSQTLGPREIHIFIDFVKNEQPPYTWKIKMFTQKCKVNLANS